MSDETEVVENNELVTETQDAPVTEQGTEQPVEEKQIPSALRTRRAAEDKYKVVNDAGEVDWEQSYTKATEAYKELYGKHTQPRHPNDYKEYRWEGVEDVESSPEVKGLLEFAHKAKMSQEQVDALREYVTENTVSEESFMQEAANRTIDYLEQAWGDEYDNNMEGAEFFLEKYGRYFNFDSNDPAIANNAPLLQLMAWIAPSLKDDKTITQKSADSSGITMEEFDKMQKLLGTEDEQKYWDWYAQNRKAVNSLFNN